MMNLSLLDIAIVGILGLLGVGLYGLLVCRNLFKVVVALQILVKAALLGLVAAGYTNGHINSVQSLAITVIVADTIVAVIAIALAVQIQRQLGTLDIKNLAGMRG
ncbi:MAG: NADH-quinone oxidoreductase subunit K [Anaerolineales bacterium]|jgi:NADH:ubiquinone oxidoreductase subunit K